MAGAKLSGNFEFYLLEPYLTSLNILASEQHCSLISLKGSDEEKFHNEITG